MLHSMIAAWRRLRRPGNRGYALAALTTLMLGVASVVTVYALLHRVLLEPLPVADEDTLMAISGRNDARGVTGFAVSEPDFGSWRESARSFESMAAYKRRGVSVRGSDGADRLDALLVTPQLAAVLGVAPLLGRGLLDDEGDRSSALLIAASVWRDRFAADPAVLGRSLVVEGRERTIVGVMPDDVGVATDAGLWLPIEFTPREQENRGDRRLDVVARLAPGVSRAQAQAEMDTISAELARRYPPSNADWAATVAPLREQLVGADERTRLWMLLGAVGLLLLVTCSNLAGLQIARAADRQHELGVRQALGAGRARLRLDVVAETALLVAAGTALALPLAAALLRLATQTLQASQPRLATLAIDPRVAATAIAVCAVTALAFAAIPAAIAARAAPTAALNRARNALGRRSAPLRAGLVVVQFAIATVLLSGALALGGRLWTLAHAELGYVTERLLTVRIALPRLDSQEAFDAQRRALSTLADEARAIPGVRSATIVSEAPLGSVDTQSEVAPGPMPADASPPERRVQASWRIVDAQYFETFGVPLLSGRAFAREDEPTDRIILSRSVAERVFGSAEVVGRLVTMGNGQRREVVGVAEDTYQRNVAAGASPAVYLPITWYLWETMTLAVRTEADPATVVAAIRERAARVMPDRPLYDVRTMDEAVALSTAGPRLQAVVVALFALAAALIAAVGIGAITAYLIARRTGELALRFALGASPLRVRLRVLGGAGTLAAAGVMLGALGLLVFERLGLQREAGAEHLPAAFAVSVAVLLTTCLAACWWPARRAARIDPALALRGD
ncbi:MAG: ADOP family duplicated permease [Dokdonella sp.]|nr:ADOP family duplicated permease [Dokdonella sp.]